MVGQRKEKEQAELFHGLSYKLERQVELLEYIFIYECG